MLNSILKDTGIDAIFLASV